MSCWWLALLSKEPIQLQRGRDKKGPNQKNKKTFSILHKAYVTIVVKTKLQVLLSKLKIIKMAPSATDLCIIFKDLNSFSKVNRKIRKLTKIVERFCRTFWSTLLLFNPRHFGFILDTPRHEKDWRLRHGIPKWGEGRSMWIIFISLSNFFRHKIKVNGKILFFSL